jgi:hypothetical protein
MGRSLDLMKTGIINPTKVVRSALQNAVVAEKPEERGLGGGAPETAFRRHDVIFWWLALFSDVLTSFRQLARDANAKLMPMLPCESEWLCACCECRPPLLPTRFATVLPPR